MRSTLPGPLGSQAGGSELIPPSSSSLSLFPLCPPPCAYMYIHICMCECISMCALCMPMYVYMFHVCACVYVHVCVCMCVLERGMCVKVRG